MASFHTDHGTILELANVHLTRDESGFLKGKCPYLNAAYLQFLADFRFRPSEHIKLEWKPLEDRNEDDDQGEVVLKIKGLWLDTILYEIPLLALVSEAYFKFCDRAWSYDGQEQKAYDKGVFLFEEGCMFSEFGSRRRRDYHTQDLVIRGLRRAQEVSQKSGWKGRLQGTSNVHFAMKYDLVPVGTVAHEWFMGVAAITNNYEDANEIALQYWVGTFGEGVSVCSALRKRRVRNNLTCEYRYWASL